MLKTDREAFLCIPNETGQHVILRGHVCEGRKANRTAEFETPDLFIEAEMKALLLFDDQGVLVQEPVLIDGVEEDGQLARVEISSLGDAVPHEIHRTYRLRVRHRGLAIRLDDQKELEILDISSRGLAFRSDCGFELGTHLDIVLSNGDENYRGRGIVRSAKQLSDGTNRCGVECLGDGADRSLFEALPRLFEEYQWEELRGRSEIGSSVSS
jgi:hypothetical protein